MKATKHYYYLAHDGGVFRIWAKQKPSARYKRGLWPAEEPYDGVDGIRWCASWEITWHKLQQQTYIGCVISSPNDRKETPALAPRTES